MDPSSPRLGLGDQYTPPDTFYAPLPAFDPARTPSRIYTEYAKPVYLATTSRDYSQPNDYTNSPSTGEKTRSHFMPANIQSYLENTEPIYQNENPNKFYELITPQKFIKPQGSSIKSSDSFNKIPQPMTFTKPSAAPLATSPKAKRKSSKYDGVATSPETRRKNVKQQEVTSSPDVRRKNPKNATDIASSPDVRRKTPKNVTDVPSSPDVRRKSSKNVTEVNSSPDVRRKNAKQVMEVTPSPETRRKNTKQPEITTSPDVKEEKKKKWSLGGLFRRRKKTSESDSSSQEEDAKMGFLARRRSRREKRKQRANAAKTTETTSPVDTSTMSADSLTKSPVTTDLLQVKTTSKDSLAGSHERLSPRSSRHQDSSLSRNSSGGSGSLEGLSRRERRAVVKQRAVALRRHESSSEDDSTKAGSLHRSGSLNRRSRYARTERYIKRLSRDEESVLQREAETALQQQRLCKSDAEGGFTGSRWTPMNQDNSDHDARYYVTSATPSPGQSPQVRHKNILHLGGPVPLTTTSNPASLERRSHHNPNGRPIKGFPQQGHSPLPPTYDQKPPFRHPSYENFPQASHRSSSYDNMHRISVPTSPEDNVMVVQFPVGRISQFQLGGDPSTRGSGFVAVKPTSMQEPMSRSPGKPGPPPPPPRDPQRRVTASGVCGPENARPMSYAFDERRHQGGSFLSLNNQPTSHHVSMGGRSNSENQIVGVLPRQAGYHRPASTTPEEMMPMPGGRRFTPDATHRSAFQYYADQSPRSRKPIHIQYQHGETQSNEQPIAFKPQPMRHPGSQVTSTRHPVSQVTEFWRQKEQETGTNIKAQPPTGARVAHSNVSISPSSHHGESHDDVFDNEELPSDVADHGDKDNSDSLRRKEQQRPLSMVLETHEHLSLNSDHGNHQKQVHQELTPKMRYLMDCLPSARFPAESVTAKRGSENMSGQGGVVEGVFKARPAMNGIVTATTKVVPKPRSIHDTNPKLPFGGLNTNPVSSFMLGAKDINSNSIKPLTDARLKKQYSFQEPAITSKDFGSPLISKVQKDSNSVQVNGKTNPPAPPVRRYSRQLSSSSLEASESCNEERIARKGSSSNLEDALDELEAIYKSLQLGDDDLLDRAERRDLPTKFQLREPLPEPSYASSKGSMSDSGYDLIPVRKRAPSSRRSGIPDRVTDDMAYRRLHPKDRPNSQNIISQAGSFLLTSPVLSQASSINQGLDQEHLRNNKEPDIMYDDVVYRNIRHVNNSLKVQEPQLPFGIPVGPVAPAPNSDYLRSKPSDRYRPTFKPRRTPDVVGDDLAYRSLRKDGTKDGQLLTAVENALHDARLGDTNFSLRKRRAVRSLSANLPNLIGQDKLAVINLLNLADNNGNFEKAQSLTHLPDALEIAQKILEGKEVIGGGSNVPWTNENPPHTGDRNSLGMSTSTETLTDSRANLTLLQDALVKRNSWHQKLRVNVAPTSTSLDHDHNHSHDHVQDHNQDRNLDRNVLPPAECSRFTPDEHELPIPESVPGSPLDEAQLEDLLSALARDARVTSEQLSLQLAGFKNTADSGVTSEELDLPEDTDEQTGYPDVTSEESSNPDVTTKQLDYIEISSKQVDYPEASSKRNSEFTNSACNKIVYPAIATQQLDVTEAVSQRLDYSETSGEEIDHPEAANAQSCLQFTHFTKTAVPEVTGKEPAGFNKALEDGISDDSLDWRTENTEGEEEDKLVLEDLHIYEPSDMAETSNAVAPKEDQAEESMTEEDQEIQEIFHWETNRNFEDVSNNNNIKACVDRQQAGSPPTAKPRSKNVTSRNTVTSTECGAAGSTGSSSAGEAGLLLLACTFCTQHMLAHDWLTVVAICIALVALFAILML